jgi:hypothetical protein
VASRSPSISADGRFVAFVAGDSNLVPGDTNLWDDVLVYDRQTGLTEVVSIATDGAQSNGHADQPMLSADGRLVAFISFATNLTPGVLNDCSVYTNGVCRDVFLHDRQTGLTERVTVASDGTLSNDWSFEPALSADGRFVAFHSYANNLVPGDTNECFSEENGHCPDIFVRERINIATLEVTLDVKPGSFPNSINPRSNGVIPVAILTTDLFDASTADPTTLRFGVIGQEAAAVHTALADVDGDGDADLKLHFQTQAAGLSCGATSAVLTGQTWSGQPLHGSDSIQTTGCH